MKRITAPMALLKSEALLLRGRGGSSYSYQDGPLYDSGCYDWEVVCTPDSDDSQEFDFSDFGFKFGEDYDAAAERGGFCLPQSRSDVSQDYRAGQAVIDDIRNGDVPIVESNKVRDFFAASSTAASVHDTFVHQVVEHYLDDLGEDVAKVAKIGRKIGVVGATVGVVVSIYDVSENGLTVSNICESVGAGIGFIGCFVCGPVGWTLGGISLCMSIYSYYLDSQSSNSNSSYR